MCGLTESKGRVRGRLEVGLCWLLGRPPTFLSQSQTPNCNNNAPVYLSIKISQIPNSNLNSYRMDLIYRFNWRTLLMPTLNGGILFLWIDERESKNLLTKNGFINAFDVVTTYEMKCKLLVLLRSENRIYSQCTLAQIYNYIYMYDTIFGIYYRHYRALLLLLCYIPLIHVCM